MARIKVAVSPFYRGEDWTDEATGVTFVRDDRVMQVYSIPENVDLTGIKKAMRLNSLILLEGNLDLEQEKKVEPKVEEVVEAPEVEQEAAVEVEVEAVEEPKAKKKKKK